MITSRPKLAEALMDVARESAIDPESQARRVDQILASQMD